MMMKVVEISLVLCGVKYFVAIHLSTSPRLPKLHCYNSWFHRPLQNLYNLWVDTVLFCCFTNHILLHGIVCLFLLLCNLLLLLFLKLIVNFSFTFGDLQLSFVKHDLEEMDSIMSTSEGNITEHLLPLKDSFFVRESR